MTYIWFSLDETVLLLTEHVVSLMDIAYITDAPSIHLRTLMDRDGRAVEP
jgi:hypothetical protein